MQAGIRTIMLTGDNEVTARAIQKEVGVDEVIAGVLPAQKEEKVAQFKEGGHTVAMVGDGINDAPALAACRCRYRDRRGNGCGDRERGCWCL